MEGFYCERGLSAVVNIKATNIEKLNALLQKAKNESEQLHDTLRQLDSLYIEFSFDTSENKIK